MPEKKLKKPALADPYASALAKQKEGIPLTPVEQKAFDEEAKKMKRFREMVAMGSGGGKANK